jgi:Putative bacterial sensory transduction regulator
MPQEKPETEEATTAPPAPEAEKYPKPRPPEEPESVVKLREQIEGKLAEMLDAYGVDPRGSYVFGLDSARVFIVPAWLQNEATVVRVFAITNLDVPVTAQLTAFLLEKNLDFVIGAFALDAENKAVWFNHNLLGEFMVPEQLEATLGAVAETANELDDEIKQRFGGRLYAEAPSEKISPPAAPGYL